MARDSRGAVRFWNARNGKLVREEGESDLDCGSLGTPSPDGRWEASTWRNCIAVHDARTGQIVAQTGLDWRYTAWAWSPDGTRLLLHSEGVWKGSDFLWVWSPFQGGEPERVDTFYSDMHYGLSGAAWSPDGEVIVSAADWGLGFFHARTRTLLFRHTESPQIRAIAWSSRGLLALRPGPDHIRFLRTSGRVPIREEIQSGGVVVAASPGRLTWSPDGQVLAVWGSSGLRFLDGETLAELPAQVSGCTAFGFFPGGHAVAVGLEDNRVLLLDPLEHGPVAGETQGR